MSTQVVYVFFGIVGKVWDGNMGSKMLPARGFGKGAGEPQTRLKGIA